MTLRSNVGKYLAWAMNTAGVGDQIAVHRFTGQGTSNQYGQAERTYANAVMVRGILVYDPNPEERTQLGILEPVAGVISFIRTDLEKAFPSEEIVDTITGDDELVLEGKRYAVTSVHPTARISQEPEVLVVAFNPKV